MQPSSSCSPPLPTSPATVCLQGHKIKNSNTQLAQRLREIPAGLRVIISGTPIQNNLMELHSLFDFVAKVCDAKFHALGSASAAFVIDTGVPYSSQHPVLQQQSHVASMYSRGKDIIISRPCTVAAHAASTCSPKKQQVSHHSCQCCFRVQHQAAACPHHSCACGLHVQDLLGDVRSFKVNFERCITAGNDKHAGTREREQAASKAAALRSIIAPYFLRREKKEVLQGIDRFAQMVCLPGPLSPAQTLPRAGLDAAQDRADQECRIAARISLASRGAGCSQASQPPHGKCGPEQGGRAPTRH